MKKVCLFVASLVTCIQLSAAPPVIITPVSVVPLLGSSIGRYEKFELGIQLSADLANPFDPDEIDVYAEFINVSTGRLVRVNGFWYQDYDMYAAAPPPAGISDPCNHDASNVADPDFLKAKDSPLNWRIRFSPDEEGTWEYTVYAKNGNAVYPSATTQYMVCVPSDNKGNIGVGSNKTNFVYKGGKKGDREESFIPLGLNTRDNRFRSHVFNRTYYNFVKENIEELASVHGNTIRLFMTAEDMGIEWDEDGLGVYFTRQKQAYALDKLFELAEANNVKIQLVLQMNGDDLNPYLALLSDPGHNQFEFFSNPQCKDFFKRRLRYIIARWGYSTSLLAYEFWNEVALISNDNLPDDTLHVQHIWELGNAALVDQWHTEMVDYAKTMDDRHMYTTSLGSPVCNDLVTTSLDFLGDHWYTINKNVCYNNSVFAQRSVTKHDKPYLMGESGPGGRHGCFPWQLSYTRLGPSDRNNAHDDIWFHNDLWSSLFNGSAGGNLYWNGYTLIGTCGGNKSYKGYEPASKFLAGDDFFTKKLKWATNEPKGPIGDLDIPHGDGSGYDYGNNSIPMQEYAPFGAVPNLLNAYLHYDIKTSNDAYIDVFATSTTDAESKIYGWVHLNEYYWGKTNFILDCKDPFFNASQGVPASSIATLDRETMTFNNVECDGYYKVDFYSTWPDYDVNSDGVLDQGGVIAPFHQDWIRAGCGQLTVGIPKLTPLASYSTAPYSPDYAFKITKMGDAWSHSLVDIGMNSQSLVSVNNANKAFYSDANGAIRTSTYNYGTHMFQHELVSPVSPTSAERVNGVLCANEYTQVFYKGGDNRLQCYYMDNSGIYNHIWMTDWSSTSQNVGNYMAMVPNNIYYQGADAKMHRYLFNGTTQTWSHSILPVTDPSHLVGGAVTANASGTQVYYKGADNRLQCYYLDNTGAWNHIWMTDWASTSQNVAGDLKCAPEGLFYAGTDGKLHKYYFDAATSTWVHVLVKDQNYQTINIPSNTQISLKGNADLIYFKGANGHMQQLYNKLSNHTYTQDEVICPADLVDGFKNNGNIAAVDAGEIYYIGTDNNLHMYAWDAGCNPRSQAKDLKTGKLANGSVEDLSDKFGDNNEQGAAANAMPMISVVPNPFANKLTVNTNNAELLVSVDVVDVFGRRVFASTELNSKFEISTDAFAPGIYVVTIYRDGTVLKKEKVVKK